MSIHVRENQLFVEEDFIGHSGGELHWKIDMKLTTTLKYSVGVLGILEVWFLIFIGILQILETSLFLFSGILEILEMIFRNLLFKLQNMAPWAKPLCS